MAPEELDDLGSYDYAQHPGIFLGRRGLGPLRVGCDTNVLIDILEHGHRAHVFGEETDVEPSGIPDDEEVLALLALLDCWYTRDARLVFFERQAHDHRTGRLGRLDPDERRGEVWELNAGWFHVVDDPAFAPEGELPALDGMPANTDTELVALAIRAGCHVFLTRDRKLAKRTSRTQSLGIALMLPTQLLDALAMGNDLYPYGADGGYADDHKWVHFQRLVDPEYTG